MPQRLLSLVFFLAACAKSGPGGGSVAADSGLDISARAAHAVAFRLPRSGGPLSVYALPTLDTTSWGAGSRLTGARSAVGVDLPGRRLLFLDTTGAIASFDLVSLRQKTIAPRRSRATVGADGALLAVDSAGSVTESQPWGTRTWPDSLGRGVARVFAAPGPRLIAIRHTRAGDSLSVAARENGIALSLGVPGASDETASRDGDAVAFATDSGLVVYEDREMTRPWFVRLAGHPHAVVFSPSGHRIYVALRDKGELAVVDRFTRRTRASISLPAPATGLRADPWGRALLVRADTGRGMGDIWVVGVARNGVLGTMRGQWSSDLPTAAEGGVILSREGNAVVARDMRSLDSLAAIPGAAGDLWFAGQWIPTTTTRGLRAAAVQGVDNSPPPASAPPSRESTPRAVSPPSALTRQPAGSEVRPPAEQGSASFWIQLTATRTESSARALVTELRNPYAQVVAPKTEDDTWRVMVGPFWTREAADSAGRSIGRPYWVVDRSRDARQ